MPVDLLAQRIYAIARGDEDVNDHTQLRHDVVTNLEGTPQHLYEEIYCARGIGSGNSSYGCWRIERVVMVFWRIVFDYFFRVVRMY